MQYLKAACGLLCFLILASNLWSMSRWSEARGVYDDVCYLRQAHLFQRFGLDGLDTNIARDDDHYVSSKLKEIGFPTWSDPNTAPCHSLMPATNKRVMQYPPGTGFVLALFPQGFQVIPLYAVSTVIVFGFALLGISYARSRTSILLTAAFGCLAIYLMINPTKASYSVAPAMVVCALAAFLTAKLFSAKHQHRLVLTGLVGLLIGLAVNFRLPNLLLSSGYFVFFFVSFLLSRRIETVLQGGLFGAAFLVGECDQCRQSLLDDLRNRRRDAPRIQPWRHHELSHGHAICFAGACRGVDRLILAFTSWHRHETSRCRHGCKSSGEFGLLPDPSPLRSLLYDSGRHALALDLVVHDPDSASGPTGDSLTFRQPVKA
jgi:hypothetical protein